jgi:hypothetical protein
MAAGPAVGPAINNAGRVAFAATTTVSGATAYQGVWSDAAGTLSAVARSDSQAPGTSPGTNFATSSSPILNDAGRTSFVATLDAPLATNTGIWSQDASGLTIVARKGSPAPGAGAGVNFAFLFTPNFNDAGRTAFPAELVGAGVTAANDMGIWAEKAGGLTLMVRTGSAAPGTPAGVVYDQLPIASVRLNSAGQIAFRGFLTGPGVTQNVNRIGIWAERPTGLELVAREGSPVPGIAGANFALLNDPSFNRNGHTAFVALMTGVPGPSNAAILSEAGGSLAVAARRGAAAPGTAPGVTFNAFTSPMLNGEGQLAFSAILAGAGVTAANDTGFWSNGSGSFSLIAREAAQAPGADTGHLFSAFANPVFNSAGQLAFSATLSGTGVTGSNDNGIWAQGLDGNLRLVAREGSPLQVSPGVNRTIAGLSLAGGVNTEDGRRSGFNDLGEVAFLATFTDGTSGIFVSDVARAAAGDFDGDGDFDGADFLTWQRGLGRVGTGLPNNGDANADGNVNAADLAVWQSKFDTTPATMAATAAASAVPEPGALSLALMALACITRASRSRPS